MLGLHWVVRYSGIWRTATHDVALNKQNADVIHLRKLIDSAVNVFWMQSVILEAVIKMWRVSTDPSCSKSSTLASEIVHRLCDQSESQAKYLPILWRHCEYDQALDCLSGAI